MARAAGARDLGRAVELPQHKLAADFTGLGSPVPQTTHLWLLSSARTPAFRARAGFSLRGYAGAKTWRIIAGPGVAATGIRSVLAGHPIPAAVAVLIIRGIAGGSASLRNLAASYVSVPYPVRGGSASLPVAARPRVRTLRHEGPVGRPVLRAAGHDAGDQPDVHDLETPDGIRPGGVLAFAEAAGDAPGLGPGLAYQAPSASMGASPVAATTMCACPARSEVVRAVTSGMSIRGMPRPYRAAPAAR
jgi:hypothetical protein